MCMYIWTYVNSEMYMMPQLWPMLATKISYMMNMLQYVYYFYACIECTYIAAILHILYSTSTTFHVMTQSGPSAL